MSARTVLLAAADEITRVGWGNGRIFVDGLDVHTAIQQSADAPADGAEAIRAVYIYLCQHPELANGDGDDLHFWNRHSCPDQATAVAVLRGAAEMAGPR